MISDHYRSGNTERLIVQIITVDPSSNRIEGVGKDAAVIQIGVSRMPAVFRWPVQNEYWTIIRENGQWQIEALIANPDDQSVSGLDPGDALIQSNTIWTPSGDILMKSGDAAGGVLAGTYPNPTLAVDITPPIVTSLPPTPVDGQEIYYKFNQNVNPTDAKLIYWHLRWDQTAGAWYPIGTQESIYAYYGSQSTFATYSPNAWGNISANDPKITTFPLAGDYEIQWGCGQFWSNGGVFNWYIAAYWTNADQTANGTQPTSDILSVPSTATWGSGSASKKINVSAATISGSIGIRHRYYIAGGASQSLFTSSAFIKAYPRRITS